MPTTIGEFFDAVYGPTTGWVRIARRDVSNNLFQESFYQWPIDRSSIVNLCISSAPSYDVFYSPALFKSDESSKKSNVQSARVAWLDFDGNVPDPESLKDVPQPSIRLISSSSGHEHWYWLLDADQSTSQIETLNRKLVAATNADTVWDAGRLLRPPGTYNHKRSKRTTILQFESLRYTLSEFKKLPEISDIVQTTGEMPEKLPRFEDVIAFNTITPSLWRLIEEGRPTGYRSEGLYQVAVKCAEPDIAMEPVHILSILLNCDNRWGKFKGRTDQLIRLWQIVDKAKQKYPDVIDVEVDVTPPLFVMTAGELLSSDIKMDWVWENVFEENGGMVLTGQSGIGKTQFSIQAACEFLLGRELFGSTTRFKGKIGFLSLEMGAAPFKEFLAKQFSSYSQEEIQILRENLIVFPLGEPLFLDEDEGKIILKTEIERHELSGIMIDSLGQAAVAGLSQDEEMRNLMNWIQLVRSHMNLFTWIIHHHRKASGDNKRPKQLSDVYGSQYISSMASSVLCLWPSEKSKAVELSGLKVRMGPQFKTQYLMRDEHLIFKPAASIMQMQQAEELYQPKKQDNMSWMKKPKPSQG